MSPLPAHRPPATLNLPPDPTPAAAAPARHRPANHTTPARRRHTQRHHRRGHPRNRMQIRTINGRDCTDFAGAAERAGRSQILVRTLAAARADNGFPEPVRAPGDSIHQRAKQYFAIDDLDAFFARYDATVQAATAARVTRSKLTGDPDELLDGKQIATALKISYDTWRSWVRDAIPQWATGHDAYIAPPDDERPGGRGVTRTWKRRTIQTFVDQRGTAPSGRTPGGGVTLDDLRAVDPHGDRPTADVMADLQQRLGHPVSRQTVARRRRDLRNADTT